MRIVYCTDSICYLGGIQRITIAKANALAEIDGNEVWIVVTDNKRQNTVLPVSEKVRVVDLDVNYYEDDWKSKLHVLKGIFVKRKEHKRKLTKLLNNILPDIVISTGTSEKIFLPDIKLSSKPAFIREIHFVSNYRRLDAKGLFANISAYFGNLIDYHFYIKRYDRIVVLTKEDKERNWKDNERVVVIPNPITVHRDYQTSWENKTVIAVGRLVLQKNFSSLISAWSLVHQSHPDWILEIWGDGNLKEELAKQIEEQQLVNTVRLMGYTNDIMTKFVDSSIFVCTSLFEGLPLVFIEAMSCGLPVVSYDCQCGPRDIITDGRDGFLVDLGNESALADSINLLIENATLRKQMGQAAKEKSKYYSMDSIICKWMALFNYLK